MRADNLISRAWPPRIASAPPPPPGARLYKGGSPSSAGDRGGHRFFRAARWLRKLPLPAPAGHVCRLRNLPGVPRRHLQRVPEESAHSRRKSKQARVGGAEACESCHGPGSKHAEARTRRHPQSGEAAGGGCRPRLSDLPSEPADARGAHPERACAQPGELRYLPFDSQISPKSWCRGRWRPSTQSARAAIRRSGQVSSGRTSTSLPEGAMCCVDCHNPHGSVLPRSMQTVFRQRARLLELPRRQARAFRVRACAGAPGRLRGLS